MRREETKSVRAVMKTNIERRGRRKLKKKGERGEEKEKGSLTIPRVRGINISIINLKFQNLK